MSTAWVDIVDITNPRDDDNDNPYAFGSAIGISLESHSSLRESLAAESRTRMNRTGCAFILLVLVIIVGIPPMPTVAQRVEPGGAHASRQR
jgi:hypothetical protein